ncbi:MAG TPA: SDR family oxidoreductase [Acidimicrobiia bacterium]|nr:SDR family oxidoreductase [Acidimicrobiia bacterium]
MSSNGAIVVTGAARGMGYAAARRLYTLDAPVVLVDLNAEGLQAVAREFSDNVQAVVCDVSDPDAVAQLADRVGELGGLRSLAHAAGISPTMADWRRIIEVDLVGTALLVRALEPHTSPGSAAVCWASIAGHGVAPDPELDAALDDPLAPDILDRIAGLSGERLDTAGQGYGYAKRGVMRLVAREAPAWGLRGARICSISPGIIDTPQGRQEFDEQPAMATMIEMTPIKRWGQPEEVCNVVAFLLSGEASYMTGCDVVVDGGISSRMREVMAQEAARVAGAAGE